ncbi:hypothetical protein ACFQ0G_11895 [Streptomyces chiangmaiensis]
MLGPLHVPVAAAFHPLTGQAQRLPPRFRVRFPAHDAGPVRVDCGASVALQGTLDRPHRRVQVLHTLQVLQTVDVQRQADDHRLGVLAALPAVAFVLTPEPATGHNIGSGRRIKQARAHGRSHLLLDSQRAEICPGMRRIGNHIKATCRH